MKSIYVLIDPLTNEVRYIGKTTMLLERRLHGHMTHLRGNTPKVNWIKKLKQSYQMPEIQVVQSFKDISDDELNQCEIYWIKFYRESGCDLTNSTKGGEGLHGVKLSEEARLRMSKSHKGKKLSEQHRKNISLRMHNNANALGKKFSEETRMRMSKSRRGKKLSKEHCMKIKESWIKRKLMN